MRTAAVVILVVAVVTLSFPVAGTVRAAAAPVAPSATAPALAAVAKIDVNKATFEELVALPGIGSALAQAIVDFRSKHGALAKLEDLLEVHGIGEKNLKSLSKYLTVPAPPPVAAAAPTR